MRDRFPGYYRPTPQEFATLWKEALFVLDANVLLNLYRYPETARDELVEVLEQISDRLWVPFQAALEFHRHRPAVLAEQKSRFGEVRHVIDRAISSLEGEIGKLQLDKRHALIDTGPFVEEIKALAGRFRKSLSLLEDEQAEAHREDSLGARISSFIGGRIGAPPPGQKAVDEACADGEQRYAKRIPPGYMDQEKGGGAAGFYAYGGILYSAMFGDLLLWRQLIERASDQDTSSVIFITDDGKEDWWWSLDSQGKKILGPRPELVEEIKRLSNLNHFHMYNSEQFLAFSQRYLKSAVSEKAIEQVREVAQSADMTKRYVSTAYLRTQNTVPAVAEWLKRIFGGVRTDILIDDYPDIVVEGVHTSDTGLAVDVKVLPHRKAIPEILRASVARAEEFLTHNPLWNVWVVLVFRTPVDASDVMSMIKNAEGIVPSNVDVVFGRVFTNEFGVLEFIELGRT